MKKCTKCTNIVSDITDFCPKCGNNDFLKLERPKKKTPTWLIVLIVIIAIGVFGSIFGVTDDDSSTTSSSNNTVTKKEKKEDSYKFNSPFKFDDLEITISNEISFTTLDNQYSDLNGRDIIKIPVTIKNLDKESHNLNLFYYKFFGSKGTELNSVGTYFSDEESVDYAGELMPEASYTKYFYLLYDGDGKYTVKFDNFSKKIEISFDVKK